MTTSAIKILAVVAMLIDHIGYYFSWGLGAGAPLFRLIGRIAFPLFIFSFVVGYRHTRSRKKYLSRLYAMSIFMAILNLVFLWVNSRLASAIYGQHNIFVTIILMGLGISFVENLWKNRDKSVQILLAVMISTMVNVAISGWFFGGSEKISRIISGFLPSIFAIEYDYWFVLLGVAMYFTQKSKLLLAILVGVFSLWHFWITPASSTFQQGAMIFSILPMMLYNGKKGVGLKWFFYAFYPIHIIILWVAFLALFPAR